MKVKLPPSQSFNFDVDKLLNPYIPPSKIHRLPKPIARFLGHSDPPRKDPGNLLVSFWALLGTFVGLILVAGVFKSSGIQKYHPPTILASFGATAVLEYNVIKSPLGQPRNSILGHTFSSITGVIIAKLFQLSSSFDDLRWIAGALSCGLSSVVMTLTNTVHPPGGATALLAVVDPIVSDMGWALVPLIVLGSTLMVVVALLLNNIQRQFPNYYWTDKECGQFWHREKSQDAEATVGGMQKENAMMQERKDDDDNDDDDDDDDDDESESETSREDAESRKTDSISVTPSGRALR